MPFISIPLNDAKESEVLAEGEYDLRVVRVDATQRTKREGLPMVVVTMAPVDPKIRAFPIREYMMIAPKNHTNWATWTLNIRRVLAAFNVSGTPDGFDPDDLLGQEATLFVQQRADDSGEGRGPSNRVRWPFLRADA